MEKFDDFNIMPWKAIVALPKATLISQTIIPNITTSYITTANITY